MATQSDPVYFVSVTTTPSFTKAIIDDLIPQIQDEYSLVFLAITTTIEGLKPLLTSLVVVPQLLICSSQWTPEQQQQVFGIGKSMFPDIKTIAIPPGLFETEGGRAVTTYLNGEVRRVGLPKKA